MSLCIRNGVTYKRHNRVKSPDGSWQPCIHCGQPEAKPAPEVENVQSIPDVPAGEAHFAEIEQDEVHEAVGAGVDVVVPEVQPGLDPVLAQFENEGGPGVVEA